MTLDAAGCQRAIARQIIESGAEYVVAVKGNQGQLQRAVQRLFRTGAEERGGRFDDYEQRERGHGREETRRYWSTGEIEELRDLYSWPGLRSAGTVEATRTLERETTVEQRF